MTSALLRRTLHASTISIAFVGIWIGFDIVRIVLLILLPLWAAVEFFRIRGLFNFQKLQHFIPVFRASEHSKPSGAFWLLMGFSLAAWAPHPGPQAGIAVAAIADPLASLVGGRFGKGRGKSWQGSLGALLGAAAVLILMPGFSQSSVLAGCFAAMIVERWSCPFDDNLTVAPAVAWVVWYVEFLQL